MNDQREEGSTRKTSNTEERKCYVGDRVDRKKGRTNTHTAFEPGKKKKEQDKKEEKSAKRVDEVGMYRQRHMCKR